MIEQQMATAMVGTAEAVAEARGVTREFRMGGGIVRALRAVALRVLPGELVALRGRSGAGKTTLLNILLGLDDPTGGAAPLAAPRPAPPRRRPPPPPPPPTPAPPSHPHH